jgi:endonuclease YncB( thermonuclease family)
MAGRIIRRVRHVFLWMGIVAAIAVAGWYFEQQGEAVVGPARVKDGDSLLVGGVEIRLYGMDAVEHYQTCEREGRPWNCGVAATQALRTIVAGREVSCRPRERDRFGRTVAVCSADGVDLGAAMVRGGYAVAYGAYQADEREARGARRGIWSSRFDRPADWRARNPRKER